MKKSTTIIDYGLGNLFSIHRALTHLGIEAVISGDPEVVANAEHLILPGVGAFGDGMSGLRERGLIEPIRRRAAEGIPILGICLGMQLLMSESEEFGRHEGLHLIPGRVVRFPEPKGSDRYKVPNIGWRSIHRGAAVWEGTLLDGVPDGESAYFVHSYRVIPDRDENCLARTRYAGIEYCSVVRSGVIYGAQYHPEKSGPAGLRMLENFTRIRHSEKRA